MNNTVLYGGLIFLGALLIFLIYSLSQSEESKRKSGLMALGFLCLLVLVGVGSVTFYSQHWQEEKDKAKSDIAAANSELDILSVSTATNTVTYRKKGNDWRDCTATYSNDGGKGVIDKATISCKLNAPSTLPPASTSTTSTTVDPNGRLYPEESTTQVPVPSTTTTTAKAA